MVAVNIPTFNAISKGHHMTDNDKLINQGHRLKHPTRLVRLSLAIGSSLCVIGLGIAICTAFFGKLERFVAWTNLSWSPEEAESFLYYAAPLSLFLLVVGVAMMFVGSGKTTRK